jgi:CheY-like chemotaxis protein
MLADLGFTVTTTTSATEAWYLIEQGAAPDILITDHVMPAMTGTELAHAVRQRFPAMRILIVSGYAEETGIDPELPRLAKPFLKADLIAALARLGGS